MESSRIKRRRLMVSSYVSSPWPDIPAIFESLNDDTLTTILEFVGDKSYRSFGGLNKHCKEIYIGSGMTKNTFLFGYAPLSAIIDRYDKYEKDGELDWKLRGAVSKGVLFYNRKDVLAWAIEEQKNVLLMEICNVAGEEGRLDILNEVWNNVEEEDDKESVFHYFDVFRYVDEYAAGHGKLNVLKWYDTKGFDIFKESCAEEAARAGHLHILQWLREEKGLELKREFYEYAIQGGGQLDVMKWLREQKVPWYEDSFKYAVFEGNLDLLQWLHNEGCPWPDDDDDRVPEEDLELEVIDWCRVNGYGDRLDSINDPWSDSDDE